MAFAVETVGHVQHADSWPCVTKREQCKKDGKEYAEFEEVSKVQTHHQIRVVSRDGHAFSLLC